MKWILPPHHRGQATLIQRFKDDEDIIKVHKNKKGKEKMKIILSSIMLLTIYSFGFEITNQFWVDKTGADRNKQINITCNNGHKGYIYYFPNVNGYYAKNSNNKYSSIDSAASKVCNGNVQSTNSQKRTVVEDSLLCDYQSSIKKALKSSLSFSSAKFDACFGKPTEYKDCFCINKNYKAIIIKSYPADKRIDGYYKVKDDRGNILYVRKDTVR